MNTAKTIDMARSHLRAGNGHGYAAIMSSAIRAALSDRTAKTVRAAIAADNAEALFAGLNTATPIPSRQETAR